MTIYSPNYLESNEFTLTGSAGRIVPADMQDFIDSAFGSYATQQSGNSYTLALTGAGTCVETTGAGTGSPAQVTIPIPDDRDTWNPSETMIISLETNMAASHPVSATVVIAEVLRA